MYEKFAAHRFEAFEFGERISVVVDAQIEVRPCLITANHQRGRLPAAVVAARCVGVAQRSDQAGRKSKCAIPYISRGRILDDCSAEDHVACARDMLACKIPAPTDTG